MNMRRILLASFVIFSGCVQSVTISEVLEELALLSKQLGDISDEKELVFNKGPFLSLQELLELFKEKEPFSAGFLSVIGQVNAVVDKYSLNTHFMTLWPAMETFQANLKKVLPLQKGPKDDSPYPVEGQAVFGLCYEAAHEPPSACSSADGEFCMPREYCTTPSPRRDVSALSSPASSVSACSVSPQPCAGLSFDVELFNATYSWIENQLVVLVPIHLSNSDYLSIIAALEVLGTALFAKIDNGSLPVSEPAALSEINDQLTQAIAAVQNAASKLQGELELYDQSILDSVDQRSKARYYGLNETQRHILSLKDQHDALQQAESFLSNGSALLERHLA